MDCQTDLITPFTIGIALAVVKKPLVWLGSDRYGPKSYGLSVVGRHLGIRRIRAQRRRLPAARQVVLSDSSWFRCHGQALVRFRPERPGDFALLSLQGQEPPAYVPAGLDPEGPLTWVAVVDVLRATGLSVPEGGGSLRTRIRTVPIRSRRLQAEMAELFAIAVCCDVLAELQRDVAALAA